MFRPKLFILQQLKNTSILGYQKTQYLLTSLKNSWILLINSKYHLAWNPAATPETLALLAKDKNVDVRWRVAENPNTFPKTLAYLANDENLSVRYKVARNPNTPTETLTLLANDGSWNVRDGVANNPNTPQYVLNYMKLRDFIDCYG